MTLRKQSSCAFREKWNINDLRDSIPVLELVEMGNGVLIIVTGKLEK